MIDAVLDTQQIDAQREAFLERMLESVGGLFQIATVYIGDQLGLYHILKESGPINAPELAARVGAHPRYIREWLEQQATVGILEVDDPAADDDQRRYRLPAGHAQALTERDHLDYIAPLAQISLGALQPLDQLLSAFRTGGGVPYADYGRNLREGQANMNRAAFLNLLGGEWLPAIPDLHARLQADPGARVLDIGCGYGYSSIGIAQAYPKVSVHGIDLDEASIEQARLLGREYAVNGRVQFMAQDAADLIGEYDLVTAFECVHDMGNPVGVLSNLRRLAGENGTVLVMDERVGDSFAEAGPMDWFMYGFSVLHCLPAGMSEHNSAGTGTVMRADTLRAYAGEAGFSRVEVLPIDNFFFRFYRLHP